MSKQIIISRVQNGYILNFVEKVEEDLTIEQHIVFEEIDDDGLEAARNMLLYVKDYLGVLYNKHSNRNLVVDIEEKEEES